MSEHLELQVDAKVDALIQGVMRSAINAALLLREHGDPQRDRKQIEDYIIEYEREVESMPEVDELNKYIASIRAPGPPADDEFERLVTQFSAEAVYRHIAYTADSLASVDTAKQEATYDAARARVTEAFKQARTLNRILAEQLCTDAEPDS